MSEFRGVPLAILKYDVTDQTGFNFVEPIKAALGIASTDMTLSKLHEFYRPDTVVTKETDSLSPLHQRFYDEIGNTDFYDTYESFLRDFVIPKVGEPVYAQNIPSFRVQHPGNKAVGELHKDSDSGYGHQKGAINFWLPVTDAYCSNSLFVQFNEDEEPQSVRVDYGKVLVFDAVNLLHGNQINNTNQTRVSFDFRVIPKSMYRDSNQVSANTKTPLTKGFYYFDPQENV